MNFSSLLYALGSAPLFAARPFLAAFITALLARFGTHLPWLGDSQMVHALSQAPAWFTSGTALSAFGVLAVLEIASAKSPEIQAFMHEFDALLKSAVALLVSLAILDPESTKVVKTLDKLGIVGWSLSAVSASTVFGCAMLRKAAVAIIHEIDDHDDLGLQTLLAWMENTWTVLGILFLVIFPIVALVLSALTALALYLFERRARRREEASKVPCAKCGTRILPHATICLSCRAEVAAPRAVGVFGQPKDSLAPDRAAHRFQLVARKRCPDCATRLTKRQVQQKCEACGRITFASRREFDEYLAALDRRLPKTLAISFLMSAVPIVGVVPGVIYYRLSIITGLRGYIPPLRGCTTKWIVRFVNWGIIALQVIPILGAFVIPIMCWTNYAIYKRALDGRAREDLALPAIETAT